MNSSPKLRIEPLSSRNIEDFRDLLGSSEFGGCFCAVWTSYGEDWEARCRDRSQPNFLITKTNVEEGRHAGYLVYQGSDLVAWTGAGPKTAFPFLKTKLGSRISDFSDKTWSIGCLAVAGAYRGRGLADQIVRSVIQEARNHGAHAVEAYPVRPFHEPRIFRGTLALYQRMGFVEAGTERDGAHEIVLMTYPLDDLHSNAGVQ